MQVMSANSSTSHGPSSSRVWALTLGALGVVFGDIGTSPLYALRECFASPHFELALTTDNVLGILSLIFWSLTLMISLKYLAVVLRADNRGEGGILALMALVLNSYHGSATRRRWFATALGLVGAALLYGDGAITPAISVLSAVEGLKLITPAFEAWVIPIAIFILNAIFLVQRFGTGKIGAFYGPIIFVWFFVLGFLGLRSILATPEVLWAVSPLYAVQFLATSGWVGFMVLGAVVLVVTGGEALYLDMGHFGKTPIRRAWFLWALPGLMLNYFGQGALLLDRPDAIINPFYLLAPDWALPGMVILSTLATIIASQALISGVFSITRQASQLGFLPRVQVIHTSSREMGQIYVPFINWTLFAGVIWLVLTFRSSSNLAAAYGVAVTATMVITTLLMYSVAHRRWGWSWWWVIPFFSFFLVIDFGFFASNMLKVTHGGWVPLAGAAVIYLLMTTWRTGRQVLYRRLKERSMPIEEFCKQLMRRPPLRVPGTAIYMAGDPWGVPVPLLHNVKHNRVLHERVAILTIATKEVPTVPRDERVEIQEIIPNFYRIIASYGFMETPKMKHVLEACREEDIHFNVNETTFVLGRETILASNTPAMPIWREKLFAVMSKNAQRPTAFFRIPPNQVIEVGIQVEI